MHPAVRDLYEASRRVTEHGPEPEALKRLKNAVDGMDALEPVDLMSDKELIQEVDEKGVALTQWEIDFVESITGSLKQYSSLTPKQRQTLVNIHRKRVSDDGA